MKDKSLFQRFFDIFWVTILTGFCFSLAYSTFIVIKSYYLTQGLYNIALNDFSLMVNKVMAISVLCPVLILALALIIERFVLLHFKVSIPFYLLNTWNRFLSVSKKSFVFILVIFFALNIYNYLNLKKIRSKLAQRPNVLFILIDALRADHLGCYGYQLPVSPFIDSIARQNIMFSQTIAQASYTTASTPSFFTSMYPSVTLVYNRDVILNEKFITLAETLKNYGYITAAFAPNPSLKSRFNFGQGFDLYDDKIIGFWEEVPYKKFETAKKINARALRWLKKQLDTPYFLYLHYRDVHGPYVPPPEYKKLFYEQGGEIRKLTEKDYEAMNKYIRLEDDNQDLNYYLAQYDAEIKYSDDQIQYLINELKNLGAYENTLVIITADHGEEFLDHGDWNHGQGLYEELIHVPLIIKMPEGRIISNKINAQIGLIDLYPTILDVLGLTPYNKLQGKSLIPLIKGESPTNSPVFSEAKGGFVSIRKDGWKLIYNKISQEYLLFNLNADPKELHNLAQVEPQKLKKLSNLIQEYFKNNQKFLLGGQTDKPVLDEDTKNKLKALGYIN